MKFTKRSQRGFALILVLLIGALMMIPVLMLLSAVAPRRATVTGEALSDRALTAADGTVDYILNKVNAFPASLTAWTIDPTSDVSRELTYISANVSDQMIAKKYAKYYVMGYLLAGINGGTIFPPNGSTGVPLQVAYDNYNAAAKNGSGEVVESGSIWDIEDNVTTYLYNLTSQQYYAVWTDNTLTGTIAPVAWTGVKGVMLSNYIKNLSTGTYSQYSASTGIAGDPYFATDNQWIEIDANAQYIDDGTNGKVQIRTSAYLLSNSNGGSIVRNIVAEAPLKINAVGAIWPFKYAVGAGGTLTLNGQPGPVIESGEISGGVVVQDGSAGKADVFAVGTITIPKDGTIYGNVATAQSNFNKISGTEIGATYSPNQDASTFILPDWDSPSSGHATTEAHVVTIASASIYSGGSLSNSKTVTNQVFKVNGNVDGQTTGTNYYMSGDQLMAGSSNTINLYPLPNSAGPAVDCYINGSLDIEGSTTINFGTGGVIWVKGNVTIGADVSISGSGTIVADGMVTFNGTTTYKSSTDGKLAIVSEGAGASGGITYNKSHTLDATLYAPYSTITLDQGGSVFGSVVAGVGIVANSGGNVITYDKSLASGSDLLPGSASVTVSFSARTSYRSSWKEAVGVPVTKPNITTIAQSTLVFKNGS